MDPDLLDRLGVALPIFQAPMAGASTPTMAAAVSNAGGLGALGLGASSVADAREAIRTTRQLTSRPFAANVFCHAPARSDSVKEAAWLHWLAPQFAHFDAEPPAALTEIYRSFLVDEEMAQMLLEERPAAVSFHFGLPSARTIAALHAAGIALLATATCLGEGRLIETAGLDAIIAQGAEAGGHRGVFDPTADDQELELQALVRQLVAATRLPVVAAGGIMHGADIAAVMQDGAVAAQLGTAFLRCPESSIDDGYRRALQSDSARHTVFTSAVSGRKARCLINRFTALDARSDRPSIPSYPIAYDAAKALHSLAKTRGEYGFGAQWAGRGAALARELPAAELVNTLNDERLARVT